MQKLQYALLRINTSCLSYFSLSLSLSLTNQILLCIFKKLIALDKKEKKISTVHLRQRLRNITSTNLWRNAYYLIEINLWRNILLKWLSRVKSEWKSRNVTREIEILEECDRLYKGVTDFRNKVTPLSRRQTSASGMTGLKCAQW